MRSLLTVCTLFIAACLLYPATASAQIDKAVKWKDSLPVTASNLKVGDEVVLSFEAVLLPGYHIFSAKQPAEYVLPATFELSKGSYGVKLVGGITEIGNREVIYDDIFGAEVALFHKKVTFQQRVKITSANVKIAGQLMYQVCDVQQCLPGSHSFTTTFKAVAATAQQGK